jgi:phytanoyl-CoA hydroxylase
MPLEDVLKPYYESMNTIAARNGTKAFLGKKGDVMLWHGMLAHGGSTVENRELTRRSMVIHFVPPGHDRSSEVIGPTNFLEET